MIVVADASAIVEYLLQTGRFPLLADVIESADRDFHVPALCDVEVCAALRRALATRRMDEARAVEALQTYLDLPLTRHAHDGLLFRLLALRANFSAYDATYVALAEALKAPLLTGDQSLARAVSIHTRVRLIAIA